MGTTYTVYKASSQVVELDEMSNKLSLEITRYKDGEETTTATNKITPEEMIQVALEMLKVCSYWTEPGTVEKAIEEFKSKGYHW